MIAMKLHEIHLNISSDFIIYAKGKITFLIHWVVLGYVGRPLMKRVRK